MANEKKKINELVADDEDPTAELEAVTFDADGLFGHDLERESDADTFGFGSAGDDSKKHDETVSELRADLDSRAQTISRLQFDVEQLRSKWLGLETEIKAREEIVSNLTSDVDSLEKAAARKDSLLRKRDATIKALKAEIRERDEAHRTLANQHADTERELTELREKLERHDDDVAEQAAPTSAVPYRAESELQTRLASSEAYADSLRQQSQDLLESHAELTEEREYLLTLIEAESQRLGDTTRELALAQESIATLQVDLDDQREAHDEEIRNLRFELGTAQETIAESSELNSQLTSDLVDTRSFKEQLEQMLSDGEEESRQRIDALQRELNKLSREAEDYEQKLESKNAAINVLLGELTKKTEQMASIGDLDSVIQEIDYRMTERIDEAAYDDATSASATLAGSERDKVTRVLIGSIGDQVLRFPLFKDRLTIGRTADNDIQLKPSYISRRHAVIATEGDSTRVIDWGSKNGVYVNSQRVKEHFLSNGDIVAVGNAKFRYEERPKRDL